MNKKWLWLALRIAVSVVALALIFRKLPLATVVATLQQMQPTWVALGLGVGVLTVILSAWQWQVLLRKEGIALPFMSVFGLYYVGIAFNQLLPSSIGGDVAKGTYAARLSQSKVGAASATLMARVIGVLGLLLTSLPVALVAALVGFVPGWPLTLIFALVAVAYGALLMGLLFSPALLQRLIPQRLRQTGLSRKVLDFAVTLARYRHQPRAFWQATGVSVLFYAASNLNFYCFGLALHITTAFWFYWIAVPLAALTTMLPVSLNGYGVRGATFVALFALMQVAGAAALSLSLAMEAQLLLFALVGAAVLPFINHRVARVARRPASRVVPLEDIPMIETPEIPPLTTIPAEVVPLPTTVPLRARLERWQPRTPRQWLATSVTAVVVIALVALVGMRIFAGAPRVTLYTVQTHTIAAYVGGGGLTYPAQSLQIAYPVSAQVLKVNVQVGQAVLPGQALLTLDTADLTAQLQIAYSEWQSAQNYANSLASEGAPAAQQASAQQQAAVAKSRYDALNQQISSPAFNNGVVSSTFTGVVTDINVVPGSYFKAGATLLTLQDTRNIIVRAQFPLSDAGAVQLGQTAEVDPDALAGASFTGTVTSIVPTLSKAGSSTFEVWITVPNPQKLLFSNESVFARVAGQQTLPTVPELAVLDSSTNPYVFVYANGRVHIRQVVIGVHGDGVLGIASGLTPGDQVIETGQYQLTDNEAVSVNGR
jgi:RND family efflux transporter MFP subunit